VHLVGFIIGIYHDSRSPERQIIMTLWTVVFSVFLSHTSW